MMKFAHGHWQGLRLGRDGSESFLSLRVSRKLALSITPDEGQSEKRAIREVELAFSVPAILSGRG